MRIKQAAVNQEARKRLLSWTEHTRRMSTTSCVCILLTKPHIFILSKPSWCLDFLFSSIQLLVQNSIAIKFLNWNKQGNRNTGLKKQQQKIELETEMNDMSKAWKELQEAATDRKAWRELEDLCPNWGVRRQKAWQKLTEDPCPNWVLGAGKGCEKTEGMSAAPWGSMPQWEGGLRRHDRSSLRIYARKRRQKA